MSEMKCTEGILIEVKKITIYELLGLIKDGETPKKIEVKYGKLYEKYKYDEDLHWYVTLDDTTILTISNKDDLDRCVEFIPKVESFKEIKKIELNDKDFINTNETGKHHVTTNVKDREVYMLRINDLIENQNKLIEMIELIKDD